VEGGLHYVRSYELVFIVRPDLDRDGTAAVVERVTGLISRRNGKLLEVEPWGLRRLAYPIQKQWEGQYVLMRFEMEPRAVAELERDLLLLEPVMRHLVVRME
jgi:small subunit ribosomal protein S6